MHLICIINYEKPMGRKRRRRGGGYNWVSQFIKQPACVHERELECGVNE
jgi:hypothetical protein